MTIKTGTNLGHYKVEHSIGAGGMGEVYKAHDSRLDREVAIKVLPADFSKDEDRLQRFEQEAKATSALNHPNILTVYDIGEHEGSPYIVAELLDGEELRDRLNEGPIPLRKSIDYAQQIVSGLSAAHEKGIVHRDLKPENIFITKDDRVKILDFGLAKLRERESSAQGSEDATRKALTDPGLVMGTAGYMSPEQVRGHAVDQRSDIFSFGAILFEMLTGKRAFDGDSIVELMHSILKDDVPEVEDSGARIPPALDKLMRRCLEKKPDHRFHSAHDLGFALDAISMPTTTSGSVILTAPTAAATEPAKMDRLRYIPWAIAALLLLFALFVSYLYFGRSTPQATAIRFAFTPPEKTSFTGASAISPDGKQVAFTTIGPSGMTSLWVRPMNELEPREFAGTEGAQYPFWSPDSRFIGYFAGGKLRKIDVAGGPSQPISDVSNDTRGGAWSQDGTIIFSPDTLSPLYRVPANGGAATPFTTLKTDQGETSHRWPSFLPDGKHFIYYARGSRSELQGLYVSSLDSTESKLLIPSSVTGSYAEADGKGYILFVREKTLMAQPFDAKRLELSGEAVPIVQGVLSYPTEIGPTALSAFSAAAGNLIYRTGDQQSSRLTWFDRSGKANEAINEAGFYHEPSLSADGKKVLFGTAVGPAGQDIFLIDMSRGSTSRLTFDPASEASSSFSPDETQIAFFSNRTDKVQIYKKPSNGAGTDELLFTGTGAPYPDSWSPDGKYLMFEMDGGPKTKVDLWLLPMPGGGAPISYLQTDFVESHAQFSPDGKWVAYTSDDSGRPEVFVQSFPVSGAKWQISTGGGDQPQWRGDGKELYYLAPDRNLMAVSIEGTTSLEIGRPAVLFQTAMPPTGILDDRNNYAPTKDGQRFIVNTLTETTNSQPLNLILNWAADLKK